MARIVGYIHLQVLVDDRILTSDEVKSNSRLLLEFTKYFTSVAGDASISPSRNTHKKINLSYSTLEGKIPSDLRF